ncbi:hypothetical protein L6452_03473 [Arctium lappa]|uniref:Uncharacterized protein n=1 Tax=Arctium lappa TaxID=4217 RepID=A0ACB9FN90_ARCLA|nr:hypothetical protein L6452_03473 [Arctium lappa]
MSIPVSLSTILDSLDLYFDVFQSFLLSFTCRVCGGIRCQSPPSQVFLWILPLFSDGNFRDFEFHKIIN